MTALHAEGVQATADMRPADGERLLRAALRQATSTEDSELRGRILVSLAHAEAEQGHVEPGLRLLDEAEPLLPPGRRGVLYGQRGLMLLRIGRHDLALPAFDAAVAVLRATTHEREELARVLLNRGVLHLGAGNLRAARADLHGCAEVAGASGLARLAAKARHNLAYVDFLAGDLPAALRVYRLVADDYATLMPSALPVLAVDRARALLAAGLFGEADAELADAMDRFRRQGLSQDYAEAVLARADAALLAGRPADARRWAHEARRRFRRRGNARWAALASLTALRADLALSASMPTRLAARARGLAVRLRALGLADDARLCDVLGVRALVTAGRPADAARQLAARRPPREARLDARLQWRLAHAEVASAAGRPTEASRQLRAGLAELGTYRSRLGCLDLQTGATVHGRELAGAGLRTAIATGSAAAVYRWSERARAQALLLPAVHPPADPDTAAALEELRQVHFGLREAELSGRPAGALRARRESLRRRLREDAWGAAGPGVAADLAPLGAVRDELRDAAMVVYLRDGASLHALVLADGEASLRPLGPFADAEAALSRLRADLDAAAGRVMRPRLAQAVAAATGRDAAGLEAGILRPLLDAIGDRDLVVVPTGTLVTVPWAVLPSCAGRSVTVAPSATTWHAARQRLAQPHEGTSLLVAGPGNNRGDAEIAAIAAVRPQSTVLMGASATPSATLAALDTVALAHLAAHGRHEADNALFSTLDLAGGPLMGYDLQRLTTAPTVVVLSSCDLGLADVRLGDETLGVAAALLSVGTCTVVASVSRVADETAMTVMTRYHQGTIAGRSAADALARAATLEDMSPFVCLGAS